MRGSFLLAGIGLAVCGAGAAIADDGAPPSPPGHLAMNHVMPVPPLPKSRAEVQAQVRARFIELDRNHDGYLAADELPQPPMHGMAGGRPDKSMLDHMFAMMDKNGDGRISKPEFEAFHTAPMHVHAMKGAPGSEGKAPPSPPAPAMHDMHRMMAAMLLRHADSDHDGKVSLAEAEAAALAHFDRLDTNHDGMLSEEERAAAHMRRVMRLHHPTDDKRGDMPPPSPR